MKPWGYLLAVEDHEPDRILYLAVPANTYDSFFQKPFIQKVINRRNLRIIVYESSAKTIVQWIK